MRTDENGRPLTYWGGLAEPKQETIEEAAERTYQKGLQDDIDLSFYDGVRLGAKWMEEEMEKLKDFDTWKEWKNKN